MSTLWVVRHGQASFLADNYDRLSALGERQAHLLGEHWAGESVALDQVYYGPAERQIRTGEIIRDVYAKAGRGWPEPVIDPDLDEFPAEAVVRRFLPELMAKHPHLAAAFGEFQAATEILPKQRLLTVSCEKFPAAGGRVRWKRRTFQHGNNSVTGWRPPWGGSGRTRLSPREWLCLPRVGQQPPPPAWRCNSATRRRLS